MVRGSKGLDHSTFGAAGDESEGDDLYIVEEMSYFMIIWVAPRIFDFSPHICVCIYGVFLLLRSFATLRMTEQVAGETSKDI